MITGIDDDVNVKLRKNRPANKPVIGGIGYRYKERAKISVDNYHKPMEN
jgi:hypothetical protein